MDKKVNATRLLRAIGEVDDKYIEEAMETAAPAKRAVTTSLRRYGGLIAAVAAAVLLLIAGNAIIRFLGAARSAEAESATHNATVAAADENIRVYDHNAITGGEAAAQPNQGAEEVDAMSMETEAAGAEEGDLCVRDADTYDCLTFVFDSLDDLEESAQLDFDAPESVDGSASCTYINYVYENGTNIAEIQYLDENGNPICAIRKAFVQRNISGCGDCYSIHDRVEADGIGSVNLLGNNSGYQVAYWTHGGYSYSVTTVEILSEDAMLELVSQVG
ncbi:MAG: hypothetical protein IJR15_03955 [Clostridiales bacterium]|nr:hypothetical protein [Clostridiales bacterium]